ncbi:MAG: hypothetical protein VB087_01620 [Candidatus Limiplasma sp.]|nr:hypothetical protein [Candidatus Limiplasma sp.]
MKKTKRDARKAALDQDTSYITLLPTMDEGFHAGYQSRAGIVSDGNQKPHEWLESVARNILTPGEDVGYAIPDVLAGEAQLRRLMRLPYEDAMRHQEMLDWRAVLAMLLLWDGWAKDATWPLLACENMLAGEGGMFQRSVQAALPPARAAFGLWLFTLSITRDGVPEKKAVGLLSPSVALAPAANAGDLSAYLPDAVRWYDRQHGRFTDPCPLLAEGDRARLVQRLRYLQALNERAELRSPLYAADASLCGLIDQFIGDLLARRGSFRERLEAGDARAERELYIRALAVCGLKEVSQLPGVVRQDDPLSVAEFQNNPLLARLAPADAAAPRELGGVSVITYLFQGKAFAIESPLYLLEPANAPGEEETLRRLWQEASLPLQFDGDWNRAVAKRFVELANRLTGRLGASRRVIALLREWSVQRSAFREAGERAIALQLPLQDMPTTLPRLTRELVGMEDLQTLTGAFSDCLLLCEGIPPFEDARLNAACAVRGAEHLFAVPPVGPALQLWLSQAADAEPEELYRPMLPAASFGFDLLEEEGVRKVRARMQLTRTQRAGGAAYQNRIELSKTYPLGKTFAAGMAVPIPTRDVPTVRLWPAARMRGGLWSAYYVLAQRPDALDVAVPDQGGFVQGEPRRAMDEDDHGARDERRWHVARVTRWPLYIGLTRGKLSLGALPNDDAPTQLKREVPAAVAIDFGSNATTMMLRQGEHIRPAALAPRLLKTLLQGRGADDLSLPDEFLPPRLFRSEAQPATFVSVMDMFGDDEKRWQQPLLDGHIYYPPDTLTLLRKNPNALYYGLKWGDEPYIIQCLRLFLKQAMVQASLAARLSGSPSLTWRVSMPNAMPLHRQEAYLETVRGLSREVAAETGMPLTQGVPAVLFASENQADGLYFRSRNEVNAVSGFLNMDVGGGTTDLSVWLGGAPYAAAETSLLLGCRQILFDSLAEHRREAFEADFTTAEEPLRILVREMSRSFAGGHASLRVRQKNEFLMDAFFAEHGEGVAEVMAFARSQGRVSLLESLLLFNFGFLFRLCGELLERCNMDAKTRAQLRPRMEICVAGGGGKFLTYFDDLTRKKLYDIAKLGLSKSHPLVDLLLVQSREPKQEVAIGLLSEDGRLRSTVQGTDVPVQAMAAPMERRRMLFKEYVTAFYAAFPMAGQKLMGHAFETVGNGRGVGLKPAAEMELEAILDNELAAGEEFAGYVRAFAAMKRLWKI